MHYIVLEKEKLNGAFPKLRQLEDGRVIMPLSNMSKLRFSIKEVDILNDADAGKLK